jgi:transcription elongation GreA/GreB family factor
LCELEDKDKRDLVSDQTIEEVCVGSWVRVTGFFPGIEETYQIVPEAEADYRQKKIAPNSPLAVALLGAREGDKILFHPLAGRFELTVLEIGPC